MTDAPPHLIQRESPRPDLLIFEVTGNLARPDVARMGVAVNAAIDALDRIDILLIFADFDGVSPTAMIDGEALKASARSNTHVRRYGVVGAPRFAEAMITLFDPLSAVDARTFDLADLAEARHWIETGESAAS